MNETRHSCESFAQKAHVETRALEQAKAATQRLFQKPLISDVMVSRSTSVKKSSNTRQTKERLFGGIESAIPEGTPLIQLLGVLDEEQLYKLNQKLCSLYQKNLTQQHLD